MAEASYPNYDLNNPRDLSAYYTQEKLDAMTDEEKLEAMNALWKNFCVSDAFEPLSLIHIFGEEKYSEIHDAKEFAKSIHMKNDSKIIEPDEYWDALSDIMYYMDEPVADPAAIALYFLSKEAAQKVKVVLSGEGSDELFGGYNIYCEPLEYTGFNKVPLFIRRVLGAFAENCMPRSRCV